MRINSRRKRDEGWFEKMRLQQFETGLPHFDCVVVVSGIVRIFSTKSGNVYTEIVSEKSRFVVQWALDKIPPGIRNGTYATIYGNIETGNMSTRIVMCNAFTFRQPRGIIKLVLANFFKKYSLTPSLYEEIDHGNPNGIYLQGSKKADRKAKDGTEKGIPL